MTQSAATELVAKALGIPVNSVEDSLAYLAVPEWDSIGHFNVIIALEERLGVAITDELVPKLTTVKAIREFVEGHIER